MKVVLCRPPYSVLYGVYKKVPKDREIRVPLGLLYLASSLERVGHEVHIIDGEPEILSNSQIVTQIISKSPDVVGISSTTPEFHLAKDIIQQVKAYNRNILTIMGGAHVSVLPQESLNECTEIDYVVVGEGEKSILKILNDRPKERIIRSPIIENLDDLPLPARHLIDYSKYQYAIPKKGLTRMDTIETARGCPFNCLFCYHLHGQKVRYRDPIKVVDELELSYKTTGARLFMFYDETFSANKQRVNTICDEIIKRKLKVDLFCWTRADCLDYDVLRKMKEAGFNQITTGIESGNPGILKILNKGEGLEQFKKVYQWMDELGMETRGSFIVGSPYETWKTVHDSIEFAKSLPLYRIGVNIMTPYPGSMVHEYCKQDKGIHFVSKEWKDYKRWGNAVVRTDELTKDDLIECQKWFLREFNGSWKVVWYHIKQIFKGNFSYFYYRPIIYAVTQRIKMVGQR
jgi:radical SAM superfamily enzyme YgiQ (UPF0313 family)